MLSLVPIFLLLAAAITIGLIQRIRPSLGYSWMVAVVGCTAASAWVVYLRWHLPQQVAVEHWMPFTKFTDSLIFGLDGSSWPYAFCLCIVMLVVVLTASARLQMQSNPNAWVSAMGLTAVGLLAVLSANLITLAMAWTAVDLSELIILLANSQDRRLGLQTVTAFAMRVSGMVLVLVAAILCRSENLPPTFSSLQGTSSLLLILAAGLRLGVLPLHLTNIQGIIQRRGLGTSIRMVAAASSLAVLVRMPVEAVPQAAAAPLLVVVALGALYGAVAWLGASDEIGGRPYWMIAVAGLAVASVLQGQPRASLAWGVMLILPGSLLSLFSARRRSILFLPALCLLGMSTLPYTPAASGWFGLAPNGFQAVTVLFILTQVCLMLGFLRFALEPGGELEKMESWIQFVYPLGLGLLVLAQWATGLIGWPGSFTSGIWWLGLVCTLLFALGILLASLSRRSGIRNEGLDRWVDAAVGRLGSVLEAVFGLGWLYRLLWWGYRRLEQAIQVLTQILEGDGGVLWAFVLLALFIALVGSRMAP